MDLSGLNRETRLMAETILGENLPTVDEDRKAGRIGLAGGRRDRPVCLCGSRNFHSCDDRGAPMSTSGEIRKDRRRRRRFEKWPGLFACDVCGRIVDGLTRDVVGIGQPGLAPKKGPKQRVSDEARRQHRPEGLLAKARRLLGREPRGGSVRAAPAQDDLAAERDWQIKADAAVNAWRTRP